MQKALFKYRNHPGDLLRNTNTLPLPDPKEDLEGFLISFLDNYQSDENVFLLNQYYKLLHQEFETEAEELVLKEEQEIVSDKQTAERIEELESFLIATAFERFYELVFRKKVEIVES